MKFDHTKHDIEQLDYVLKVSDKVIGMSNEQTLEHFKEVFTSKIKLQLLEIEDIDLALVKQEFWYFGLNQN